MAGVFSAVTVASLAVTFGVSAGPAGATSGATVSATTGLVISTTTNAKLGTILESGNTVYTLKPSKSPCNAACLKIWPEVLLPSGTTSASAGPGVNASKLGTVARPGGALQVTYGGKPLYYFSKDKSPGQVKGDVTDKWGTWSAVVTSKSGKSSSNSGGTKSSGTKTGGTAGSGGVSF
jgi:predicted lipoprotein with Yx(FWY)xxD motif